MTSQTYINALYTSAVNRGYSQIKGSLYKNRNDNILVLKMFHIKPSYVGYRLMLKPKLFDKYFSLVMGRSGPMPRMKEPAQTSFEAPYIPLISARILPERPAPYTFDYINGHIEEILDDFLKEPSISAYIKRHPEYEDDDILYFLALCTERRLTEAADFCRSQVSRGFIGSYITRGQGFYELAAEKIT